MNWDLIKQILFSIVRMVTPYIAAYLSTKYGVASADVSTTIATIVAIIWSIANKVRYEAKVNTALELPAGYSKDTLKDVIAAGDGVSSLVKK
jgi:hypothetical protein